MSRQSTNPHLRHLPSTATNTFSDTRANSHYDQHETKATNLEDFDLLAGHDFGNARQLTDSNQNDELSQILVWQKLQATGYQPSAREGHSIVSIGFKVVLFGGVEAGKRINSTATLDINGMSWSHNECTGSLPPPRAYHAACSVENLLIIHGGETLKTPLEKTVITPPINQTNSQSTDLGNPNKTIGKMRGVCPGDNLTGSRIKTPLKVKDATQVWNPTSSSHFNNNTNNIQSTNTSNIILERSTIIVDQPQVTTCLDDMYALDTDSYIWYPISCALSPLARKGHTINTCYIPPPLNSSSSNPFGISEKELTVIMFGGYSIENLTLSNSLFLCEAKAITQYYEKMKKNYLKRLQNQASVNIATTTTTLTINQMDEEPSSIVWRSLTCRGTSPTPRYRHSSAIASGTGGETLLVIIGGIGKDAKQALNDVYVLDIHTATWINLKNGHDSLSRGLGGDGPAAGIYGHTSFAIPKPQKLTEEKEPREEDVFGNELTSPDHPHYDVIVFGGSSNTLSLKSNCHSHMFAFDLTAHTWRKVDNGHTFPSSRANHAMTIVEGWSPSHPLTFQKTQSQLHPTIQSIQPFQNSLPHQLSPTDYQQMMMTSQYRSCAILFGGHGVAQCSSDTWALDLQWKHSGIYQFDNNIEQLIQENILNHDHHYGYQSGGVSPAMNTMTGHGSGGLDAPSFQYHQVGLDKSFSMNHLGSKKGGDQTLKKIQASNNKRYFQGITSSQSHTQLPALRNKPNQEILGGVQAPNNAITEAIEVMTEANSTFAGIPMVEDVYIPSTDDYDASFIRSGNRRPQLTGQPRPASASFPVVNDEEAQELILKLRKERALTGIQLHQERNENILLNEKIRILTDELTKTNQSMETITLKYENENKELRKLLIESQKKEQMLKELNQEAYQLLNLYGIDQLGSLNKNIIPFKS